MIELAGLTKVFGRTRAVDDLTCSIEPGIVTGFLGPNGAGKTTTMRMILGLDHPTSGDRHDRRQGLPSADRPVTDRGGVAGRQAGAPEPLGAQPPALDRSRQPDPATAGRRGARHGRPHQRRQQERRHPVAGHEPAARHRGRAARRPAGAAVRRTGQRAGPGRNPLGAYADADARNQGRTVFVSSHLLAEMANTADRLVVIGRGKLIASTTVSEFVSRPAPAPSASAARNSARCAGCWLTRAGGAARARRLRAGGPRRGNGGRRRLAARNAITLHELSAQQASLEEAYMKLTDEAVEYRAVSQ